MTRFSKVKWGDGLAVTDEGGGVIRIDGGGGVGPAGPEGPPGPEGPEGPPGSGGDLNYVHTQVGASASWSVSHGLGKLPAVSVLDTGDNILIPDVHYVDANNVTLGFAAATSGKAVCN